MKEFNIFYKSVEGLSYLVGRVFAFDCEDAVEEFLCRRPAFENRFCKLTAVEVL